MCFLVQTLTVKLTRITHNGVARIFVLGGPPGTFSVISPGSRPHSVGGGGVVAESFRDLVYRITFSGGGGGVVADIFHVNISITFLGSGTFWVHFRATGGSPPCMDTHANSGTHFPGLLTHLNHVTTSIHSRKKHLPKVWGAWPPPLATPLITHTV